jgi:hypothetical protein
LTSVHDPDQLLCALLAAWPENPERFAQFCAGVRDWNRVLDRAKCHGVIGILYRPLSALLAALPPRAHAVLEVREHAEKLWAGGLVDTLDTGLAVLAKADVPAIALKGPVLSERLYDDPAIRLSQDIDLLVAADHLPDSLEALASLGYQPGSDASINYHLRHHHHLLLCCPGRPNLELHFRLFSGFGIALAAKEFLARSLEYRTIRGSHCKVLAPEDELLYLAIHAANHGCERIAWLYDLKAFLLRYPNVDWSEVFARARTGNVAAALAFALETARQRLGIAHEGFDHFTASYRHRGQLARRFLAFADSLPAHALRKVGELVFQASLCAGGTLAFRHIVHYLTRIGRRRLQRYFPHWTPEDWSG